ncbi:EpsG family protein [Myroides odoratimimus]|uniref:EpsG family protein n=1 Tax=Myroides odoratimimus TaxID=76832 RepID=UPI0025787E0B|nr:EpsG family protein [Myroides odoratimimus]MDM1096707.1 EpsG family protein [Myroides odoratimimus]
MIYILVLFVSLFILFFGSSGRSLKFDFFVSTSLVCILWTLILGSQNAVGTDYISYFSIFSNAKYLEYYKDVKAEYLFYFIVKACNYLSFNGQDIFYVFAFITSYLFFKIVRLVERKEVVVLTYLYLTVSTLFHYQMNGLRQSVAVFFFTIAILYYLKRDKKIFFLYFFLSVFMHKSAIIIMPVFLLLSNRKILSFLERNLFKILILSSILCLLQLDFVIEKILGLTGAFRNIVDYSNYTDSEYIQDISLTNKLSKIMYVPIYWYIIDFFYRKNNVFKLSEFERKLLVIGVVSFCLRNLFLISSITNRVGLFFLLFSTIPIMYLIRELRLKNFKLQITFIITYIFILYFMKVVVFPFEVYSYKSVLFSILE